jgi:hypothetical protein
MDLVTLLLQNVNQGCVTKVLLGCVASEHLVIRYIQYLHHMYHPIISSDFSIIPSHDLLMTMTTLTR